MPTTRTLECCICNTRKDYKSFRVFSQAYIKELKKHNYNTNIRAGSFDDDLKATYISLWWFIMPTKKQGKYHDMEGGKGYVRSYLEIKEKEVI